MTEKKKRPGVRDQRKTRQPLQIDKLPASVHEKILQLKNQEHKTFDQISEASREFVPWQDLPADVAELFAPEFAIPRSSLHRWYYLYLERVQNEVVEEGDAAARLAELLAVKNIDGMNDAVMNALTREVFGLVKSTDHKDRSAYMAWLQDLTLSLSRVQRIQLQQKKVEADIARSEAQRAKIAAESGDPKEVYIKAAKDVLQKLRTREALRIVIDPIREELITEIAHNADTFAKQVEANAS